MLPFDRLFNNLLWLCILPPLAHEQCMGYYCFKKGTWCFTASHCHHHTEFTIVCCLRAALPLPAHKSNIWKYPLVLCNGQFGYFTLKVRRKKATGKNKITLSLPLSVDKRITKKKKIPGGKSLKINVWKQPNKVVCYRERQLCMSSLWLLKCN